MHIGTENRLVLTFLADTLKSTLHRVALPPVADRIQNDESMTKERYSIVYFIGADADAVVECLPACVDGEHPAKYEPITQRAYCQMRSKVQYRRADPLVNLKVGEA
jgi:isopenicillin N synthase-like dioxygenase